jgi:alpha-glucosidase
VYIYQGEELGLWEVEDIPDDKRQDPIFHRTGGADPGRDGSRVPLPWSGIEPPFGFSSDSSPGQEPWLPQPKQWRDLTVEAQTGDPASMLELYRAALRIRKARLTGAGALTWLDSPRGVLAFDRQDGLRCMANLSVSPAELPANAEVVLASGPLSADGELPPDTTVWLAMS